MVNADGTYSYSQIRYLSKSGIIKPMQVVPNPFVDNFSMVVSSKTSETLIVKIVSGDGKTIFN